MYNKILTLAMEADGQKKGQNVLSSFTIIVNVFVLYMF